MRTSRGKAQHWTSQTVSAAVLTFITQHRRAPHKDEWCERHGLPSQPTVRRHLGSVHVLYQRYGVRPNGKGTLVRRRGRWKDPAMQITAVQTFHSIHHWWPDTDDFKEDPCLPPPSTVLRTWGSLAELRRQAGMPGGGHEGHGGGRSRKHGY